MHLLATGVSGWPRVGWLAPGVPGHVPPWTPGVPRHVPGAPEVPSHVPSWAPGVPRHVSGGPGVPRQVPLGRGRGGELAVQAPRENQAWGREG